MKAPRPGVPKHGLHGLEINRRQGADVEAHLLRGDRIKPFDSAVIAGFSPMTIRLAVSMSVERSRQYMYARSPQVRVVGFLGGPLEHARHEVLALGRPLYGRA